MNKQMEDHFRRELGMSDSRKAEVAAALSRTSDWWAICRKCGSRLTGTPKEIAEHSCGDENR